MAVFWILPNTCCQVVEQLSEPVSKINAHCSKDKKMPKDQRVITSLKRLRMRSRSKVEAHDTFAAVFKQRTIKKTTRLYFFGTRHVISISNNLICSSLNHFHSS